MPEYLVTIRLTREGAYAIVEANSEDEAIQKADALEITDLDESTSEIVAWKITRVALNE